jgi:hypothetical protein
MDTGFWWETGKERDHHEDADEKKTLLTNLAQDRHQWRTVVNMATNIPFL